MPAPVPSDAAFRRSRRIVLATALAFVVAGIVAAMVLEEHGETAAGFLIGMAAILGIARVFYEIGIGEDRDRAAGKS
jgi:hypothetical protein